MPVHPHIRGAYIAFRLLLGPKHGSSPHTWGIHLDTVISEIEERFIPTYVGHTIGGCGDGTIFAVHPHIRGAYVRWSQQPPVYLRFIPTYVGHILQAHFNTASRSVHPHIRGAYRCPLRGKSAIHGSSPHTWGIPLDRRKKNGWFQPLFLKFYTKKLFCARSSVFRCYRGRSIPNP